MLKRKQMVPGGAIHGIQGVMLHIALSSGISGTYNEIREPNKESFSNDPGDQMVGQTYDVFACMFYPALMYTDFIGAGGF